MKLEDIHLRDPFIYAEEGIYYLYGTRGAECTGLFTGLDVYKSNDLVNWSLVGNVLALPDNFWGTVDCWAPEVHKYQGNYYMLVSFKSTNACRATHILKSDSPTGPFTPHGALPQTPADWECLDGTLYISQNNTPYLVFSHEWTQILDGEICAVELSADLKECVGKPFTLLKASDPFWADGIATNLGTAFVTDGPFLHRLLNGQLAMIWSSFSNGNYVEAIAFSDNQDITGNWYHADHFLFEKDGGHGMLFKNTENQLFFVMHSPNCSPNERPVLIKLNEQEVFYD